MSPDLLDEFRACAGDLEADECRLAILVARLLDPALDGERLEQDLATLAGACPTGMAPWVYLAERRFAGNAGHYQALDNSNLARVLETRRGIPITLGVLLMRVARTSGRAATGINFPGHFLVRVDEVLVDPFVMAPRPAAELIARLSGDATAASASQLFASASPVAVGLRMLNNVKLIEAGRAAWSEVLAVLDAQLTLAPEQAGLHLEQGDVWRRLGSAGSARAAWERALAVASGQPGAAARQLREDVLARLSELGSAGDPVH